MFTSRRVEPGRHYRQELSNWGRPWVTTYSYGSQVVPPPIIHDASLCPCLRSGSRGYSWGGRGDDRGASRVTLRAMNPARVPEAFRTP